MCTSIRTCALHMHACTHPRAHMRACARTHARARAHTHTHTHTRTHTHCRRPPPLQNPCGGHGACVIPGGGPAAAPAPCTRLHPAADAQAATAGCEQCAGAAGACLRECAGGMRVYIRYMITCVLCMSSMPQPLAPGCSQFVMRQLPPQDMWALKVGLRCVRCAAALHPPCPCLV